MLRKKEIDWFYEGGAAAIYPDGIFFFLFICIYIECMSILYKNDTMPLLV